MSSVCLESESVRRIVLETTGNRKRDLRWSSVKSFFLDDELYTQGEVTQVESALGRRDQHPQHNRLARGFAGFHDRK